MDDDDDGDGDDDDDDDDAWIENQHASGQTLLSHGHASPQTTPVHPPDGTEGKTT